MDRKEGRWKKGRKRRQREEGRENVRREEGDGCGFCDVTSESSYSRLSSARCPLSFWITC